MTILLLFNDNLINNVNSPIIGCMNLKKDVEYFFIDLYVFEGAEQKPELCHHEFLI